jgi:hypothetical protein
MKHACLLRTIGCWVLNDIVHQGVGVEIGIGYGIEI